MENQPLISVLMPAYNVEAYVAEAIESILAQTYTRWELWIVDDASTDLTRDIIARYNDSRIHTAHNISNLGYITTYNKLLTLCKGDYITFLDADDYCPAHRLEAQLNAFRTNPNLGMVGTAYDIVTFGKEHIQTIIKPLTHKEILQTIEHDSPFCGATLMVTRQVYDEVGGYRDFFKQGYAYQDYDRAYRVVDKFECANLPESLYSYRQNPTSNSKKISTKRFISNKIVQYLGKQRREQGSDDLQRGDEAALQTYIQTLLRPFEDDPSLIYRKYAENFMYQKLYPQAIAASWEAIKQAPARLVNYRTWFYCIRKTLIAKLK